MGAGLAKTHSDASPAPGLYCRAVLLEAHAYRATGRAAALLALGRLAFQQKLDDLGHDRGGALIEFCRREVRDRVRHHEEAKIRNAPAPGHRPAGHFEHVRDDRCRRNAVLFKYYAVEHTARAA